jgi:hypothetical protein
MLTTKFSSSLQDLAQKSCCKEACVPAGVKPSVSMGFVPWCMTSYRSGDSLCSQS